LRKENIRIFKCRQEKCHTKKKTSTQKDNGIHREGTGEENRPIAGDLIRDVALEVGEGWYGSTLGGKKRNKGN